MASFMRPKKPFSWPDRLAETFTPLAQGLLLLGRKIGGGLNLDNHMLITPAVAPQLDNTFALEPEGSSRLGPLRDPQFYLAI